MKKQTPKSLLLLIPVVLLLVSLTGCLIPVNLNYESARMLEKGSKEIQGSASMYKIQEEDGIANQVNAGFKYGLGVSNKYNIKFKAEGLFPVGNDGFNEGFIFLEIDNKFSLGDKVAFSLPIGYYGAFEGGSLLQLDPRLYLTFIKNERFDLSIIPKCHILGMTNVDLVPGISIGAGFSSDFDRWVIRPEIGYDLSTLSAGVALSLKVR